MPSITIKRIPDEIYRELKQEAARQRRSLNSYLIQALACQLGDIARLRRAQENWKEFKKFRDTLPFTSDSAALIREDRDSR